MSTSVGLVEALGVRPFRKTLREARLALRGDPQTPKSRFDLTSLRQLRPWLSLTLWRGGKPYGRRVPITNLFNYRQPPPELGWSVRVTDVRDFRGGQNTYDSHNGTDFAVPPGTTVVAAAPGVVVRVSSEYHRGGLKVFLDHGRGLATSYNHLTRALVAPGQQVRRGEPIAISGYSGLDALAGFPWAPPHVHFNVWLNGIYVDPFTPIADPRAGIERVSPSLWRQHNAPVPASGSERETFEETRWSEEALAAARDACLHPDTRDELARGATLRERAGASLMHLAYFPTRFDRARLGPAFSLYPERFEREPRLDLPFSSRDYDGVEFLPR